MAEVTQDNACDMIEAILSVLTDEQIAQIDQQMGAMRGEPGTGMDAAMQSRMDWIRLGTAGRNAVRSGRRSRQAQDSATRREMDARFPHNGRLKF